jgi:N-acetylglucosaminyldiphosphoundecaprenol N-acetyl-beta-D-mannosaminyltransferase
MSNEVLNKEVNKNTLQVISILGVKVHRLTFDEALRTLKMLMFDHGPNMIITLNTEMVMLAQRNASFREIINKAALILPDSIGLVWASTILGDKLPERLPGVDIVQHFAQIINQNRFRLFLLGAAPGVAEQVAIIFQNRYQGIDIVGTYAGSPSIDDEENICEIINRSKAQILLVAYKVPEQEFWIARNLNKLHVSIVINVGGTFDFIAGVTKRAPKWMQNAGLEWFFRLLQQPQRWRRMLALPRFALKVILFRLHQKMHLNKYSQT